MLTSNCSIIAWRGSGSMEHRACIASLLKTLLSMMVGARSPSEMGTGSLLASYVTTFSLYTGKPGKKERKKERKKKERKALWAPL